MHGAGTLDMAGPALCSPGLFPAPAALPPAATVHSVSTVSECYPGGPPGLSPELVRGPSSQGTPGLGYPGARMGMQGSEDGPWSDRVIEEERGRNQED